LEPDLDVLNKRIISDLRAEKWEAALGGLEIWCDRAPNDARALLNRGYCLMKLARYGEALAVLGRSLQLDPTLEKARTLQRYVANRVESQRPISSPTVQDAPGGTQRVDRTGGGPREGSRREHNPAAATVRWQSTRAPGGMTFGTQPAAESERVWLERSVVAGRYDVLEAVRGGMGVVYIAFDRELQRVVAVKTPLPSVLASGDGRARFHREAEAWIALGVHPNICSALYVQEIGGMPRLFIEYVDGGDLDDLLKRKADMAPGGRLDIAIQIASGMDYTHTFKWTDDDGVEHSGLVHRDLKPANVLMAVDGTVRITDFGLVRANMGDQPHLRPDKVMVTPATSGRAPSAGDSLSAGSWQTVTEAGGVLGTPPYLAPELWRKSAPASMASDIYAFGCVLYEVFCGQRPFTLAGPRPSVRAAQLGEWMRVHVNEDPPDPTQLAPGVDPELASLMVGCLEKSPGDRPESFSRLRTDLIGIYERTTGRAYPRPAPQRARLLADSLNNRAVSYVTLGNVARAGRGLREALEVDHLHLEATFNLCLLEWSTRGLTDAEMLRRLDEVGRASGGSSRASHLLGRLNLLLDDPEAASDALKAAAASGRASLALRRDLGVALLAAARARSEGGLYREAWRHLASVVEDSGSELAPMVGCAEALEALGEPVEAERMWRNAREQSDGLPDTIAEAALLLLPGHAKRTTLHHSKTLQSLGLVGGSTVVCRDDSGRLTIWDLETARIVRTLDPGPIPGRGTTVAVFPDGRRIAVAVRDQPIGIWDLVTGQKISGFRTHPGRPTCLEASPDGRWLVTGGSDRRVRLWDVESGRCARTFEGHEAFVTDISISADGSMFASASGDGTVRAWEVGRGTELWTLRGHDGATTAVAWDEPRRRIISGGEDCTIRVWDCDSCTQMHSMVGHGQAVTVLEVVEGDAAIVVSGGRDGTLRIWDLTAGLPLRVVRLGHPVVGLEVPQQGTCVLVGSGSEAAAIGLPHEVTVTLPFALTEPTEAGELQLREARFRERLDLAETRLDSGDFEGAIKPLLDARSVKGYGHNPEALDLWGRLLTHFPRASPRQHAELHQFKGHRGQLTAATFVADTGHAASGGVDGAVRIWNLVSGEEVGVLKGHGGPVTAVAATPNGRLLLTAGRDGVVRVWRIASGQCLSELRSDGGSVNSLASSPDSRMVVTAGEDGTVLLWELGNESAAMLVGRHGDAVAAVAVGADGRFAVSGGWDRQLIVWNLNRCTEIQRFGEHDGPIRAVAVSPDCRLLASASEDSTVRLWDRQSERCWRVLAEHDGPVQAVAFSPDARFLLSGGRDSTLRLWDIRTGGCVLQIRGHTGAVTAVDLNRDGCFAVSAGADASLRHWLIDWQPEPVEAREWDDRVRPFLEVWLRREMSPDGSGSRVRSNWSDDQIRELMEDLARRGFGWIGEDRIRRELDTITSKWSDLGVSEHRVLKRQEQRQQRRRRLQPVRRLLGAAATNLAAKLIVGTLVVIAVPLAIMSLRSPESRTAVFNDTVLHEVRLKLAIHQRQLTDDAVASYQGDVKTVMVGDAPECSPAGFAEYLDLVLRPERHAAGAIDPAVTATDELFRLRYHHAVNCLASMDDRRAVQPVLDAFESVEDPLRIQDLLSVLVRLGDVAVDDAIDGLERGSERPRRLAAVSLFYMRIPRATEALLGAVRGDDLRAQEAATFVLGELVASGAIPEAEAFPLVKRLASSIKPQVRRHALRALLVFERQGPVRKLLDDALEDPDPAVAATADEVTKILRSAKIEKFFGIEVEL